jgi:hypothetical protein
VKLIVIHGIGAQEPNWWEEYNLPVLFEDDHGKAEVIPYTYRTELDGGGFRVWANKLIVHQILKPHKSLNRWNPWDWSEDCAVYFGDMPTRRRIWLGLRSLIEQNPDALILAHSLGSVVLLETLCVYFGHVPNPIITMGSPLGHAPIRWWVNNDVHTQKVADRWINLHGDDDCIAGPIPDYGVTENIETQGNHSLTKYLNEAAKVWRFS